MSYSIYHCALLFLFFCVESSILSSKGSPWGDENIFHETETNLRRKPFHLYANDKAFQRFMLSSAERKIGNISLSQMISELQTDLHAKGVGAEGTAYDLDEAHQQGRVQQREEECFSPSDEHFRTEKRRVIDVVQKESALRMLGSQDIQEDVEYSQEDMEWLDPELYYEDLDGGSRLFIWPPDETLARDVLAGVPDVWLFCILPTDKRQETAKILPAFIEHYIRLGVSTERMVFVVQIHIDDNRNAEQMQAWKHVDAITSILTAADIDYRMLIHAEPIETHMEKASNASFYSSRNEHDSWCSHLAEYVAMLLALENIPIQDWIIAVRFGELLSFGKLNAFHYFTASELQGATWVCATASVVDGKERAVRCPDIRDLTSHWNNHGSIQKTSASTLDNDDEMYSKLVAFRGFLRPDILFSTVVEPSSAPSYFRDIVIPCNSDARLDSMQYSGLANTGPDEKTTTSQSTTSEIEQKNASLSLFNMTPYSRWWAFYKTEWVLGNAYLWKAVQSDSQCLPAVLHAFSDGFPPRQYVQNNYNY